MYYDESTALNIVVRQPSRLWKGYGDGGTTRFSFDGVNVKTIEKVTVSGIRVYNYEGHKSGSVYDYITFTTAPANGAQIRVMYSIGTGIEYNTWDSFGLVPKELPVWGAAKPKTEFVEIEGSSVYYDFTDFNNDTAGFKMISDSFEFMFAHELEPAWDYRIENSRVVNALNGKDTYVSYADQPNWRRRARLAIESKPEDDFSEIKIKYDADPYEEYKWSSSEEIPWDDFSFEDDPILQWSTDALKDGLVYNKSKNQWSWNSGWFTWDGPPTTITFEHPIGTNAWAFVRWRANPIVAEEGTADNLANYDYDSNTKTITNVYQHSALILRPGQNWVAFTLAAVDNDTTKYNGVAAVTVREARL